MDFKDPSIHNKQQQNILEIFKFVKKQCLSNVSTNTKLTHISRIVCLTVVTNTYLTYNLEAHYMEKH